MKRNLNNVVMFACNQGGHFSQMMALNELFGKYDSVLVTDNVHASKEKTPALKKISSIEYMLAIAEDRKKQKENHSGRIYKTKSYIKSFFICQRIWKKYRPKVIISTGSNIAVPLFWVGKLYGSKLIFIETRAKVYARSLTGILVRRIADKIFVQWPEMKKLYPESHYCGTLV